MVFLFTVAINSQNGIVKGEVVDDVNEGNLFGANIVVVGAKFGSATDKDGKYKIVNLTPGKYILRCTYIGYKPEQQQIDLKKDEEIEVDFKLTAEINSPIVKDITLFTKDKITSGPTIPPWTLPPIRQAEVQLYKPEKLEMKLLKMNYKKN